MNLVRDYAFPLALAVMLHGGAFALLLQNWQPAHDEVRLLEPRAIQAKLIVMEKPTREQPVRQAKPAAPAQPQPIPPTKPKPAPPQPVPQPEAAPEVDLEAQRRAQEEREREERLRELLEQSTELALQEELADLRDAEADAQTMSYAAAIRLAIAKAWSRPPSARLGMQTRLRVDLVPSGDLLAVTVLEPSGNPAFDRSAENAVRKAGRFEVPDNRRLFENNFRRFTLLFKPEDLLR